MPDFIIRKKDGVAAYQVASIIDDLRLGTTLIVRGLDLLPSTTAQLWLAAQLPESQPFNAERIRFYHHPLLTDPAGHKLSKSTQASGDGGVLARPGGPASVYQAVAQVLRLPTGSADSLPALLAATQALGSVR